LALWISIAASLSSQASIVVGIILGLASYGSALLCKRVFKIDDALDVSSVHGLTGIIGSLAIGFAAEPSVNEVARFGGGVIYSGNAQLLGIQTLAVVYAIVHSGIITALLAIVLQKTIGLRVSEEDEEHGLDVIEHQETAYNLQDGSGDIIRSVNHDERVPLLRHLEGDKHV
jgi:ammonium transporter, Amt family